MPANRQALPEELRTLIAFVSVVGAIAILYLARDTFIPLAYAITLALILSPSVAWLQKRGVHRAPAAILVIALTIVLIAGVGYVVFNQLVLVVNELPAYRATIAAKLKAFRRPASGAFGRAAENVKELGKQLESSQPSQPRSQPAAPRVADGPENILSYLRTMVQPFLGPLGTFGIVLVFTVFLLIEQMDLWNRLFKLAGVSRLNLVTQAFDDATRRVSRYLLLQFVVNVIFGCLIGIGLWLIGLPYAALWGGVAAILRIVPYLGSLVAAALPLTLCLAVFDGWHQPVLAFLLFLSLELVTANVFEPWLYGSHTGISSLALLLTAIFWASLWGPAGLILSTPLTVCVVVLGRHVKQLEFLHVLLGDEVALPADAHLYQRLLAMDDQEARSVTEEYRKDRSRVELYDGVLLPALAMAESDRHKGSLSPAREEFFFLSMREMLAEWSEKHPESKPLGNGGFGGRILSIPAHDEADEVAAAMLSQLLELEQANRAVILFPLGSDMQTMLGLLKPAEADIFCISSVPPFAFTHAQNLSAILRAQFPESRVLIGVWGYNGDIGRAAQRFRPTPPDKFVTTFAGAIEYLNLESGKRASG